MLKVMVARNTLTVEPTPPPLTSDEHNLHVAKVAKARAASMLALQLYERGVTAHHIDHRTAVQIFTEAQRVFMDTLQSGGLR